MSNKNFIIELAVKNNFLEYNHELNVKNSLENYIKINYNYLCYTNERLCESDEENLKYFDNNLESVDLNK